MAVNALSNGFYDLTMDQFELTIHTAGHAIALQISFSEERTGLASAKQIESGTITIPLEETCCRQMTFRV